jgi:hypothetical protein
MNTHVMVITYSREGRYGNEWREDGQIEDTEKERGGKESRNEWYNGIE